MDDTQQSNADPGYIVLIFRDESRKIFALDVIVKTHPNAKMSKVFRQIASLCGYLASSIGIHIEKTGEKITTETEEDTADNLSAGRSSGVIVRLIIVQFDLEDGDVIKMTFFDEPRKSIVLTIEE